MVALLVDFLHQREILFRHSIERSEEESEDRNPKVSVEVMAKFRYQVSIGLIADGNETVGLNNKGHGHRLIVVILFNGIRDIIDDDKGIAFTVVLGPGTFITVQGVFDNLFI